MRLPTREALTHIGTQWPMDRLVQSSAALRDRGSGNLITYSPKVFIPLTELCRDVCHYCTFAKTPKRLPQAYLSPQQILDIARAGRDAGCREALFTLGDKPELRYRAARDELRSLGFATTLQYLGAMAELVLRETGLLAHLNPGIMSVHDYRQLRAVAPSMGLMLESSSPRLCEPGGPHFGSPDKLPEVRLEAIRAAGEARVPLTTGLLIGIGETRAERIESLVELRLLHQRYGHIQEIIVQNFVPKPGTKMAGHPAPSREELLWTIAMTRHAFGPEMSVQVPPNLNSRDPGELIRAGINDWGGVSPVTPDYVNPESAWPALKTLERITRNAGKSLVPRLTVYPRYVGEREHWIDRGLWRVVLGHADGEGLARDDSRRDPWAAGDPRVEPPFRLAGRKPARRVPVDGRLDRAIRRTESGARPSLAEVERLLTARGEEFHETCRAADELRRAVNGDVVTYVVNRNINYTNICLYKCRFCAFSKGRTSENLRGEPYVVDLDEIARRTAEAWSRGATEVCLQGGIHPSFTGRTYLQICKTVKAAAPDMHIHAFSPLEITQGATTLGITVERFLGRLRDSGLSTLPGTAAEVLDDEVRRVICPDKLTADEWLNVVAAAHRLGMRTTATIMFGHMEQPRHVATHLLAIRDLQERTAGITEFVPLPFVHMEAPMHRRGLSRPGPSYREVLLMHAVARLVLHPLIGNIQASWVKLGPAGAEDCLSAGVNDLGGTLMNESISRAAGADHGQELPPSQMEALIRGAGREPRQRTTIYRAPPKRQTAASNTAAPLAPVHNRHAREYRVEF